MKVAKRKGVAVIIATLIMIAAAALFTSIMLYWGSAYLGQSTANMGSALFRSNNAAAEQVSIDNVLFSKLTSTPSVTYSATVFVRNFGDNPVKIAGIHVLDLQSGISPPGYDCEVKVNNAHLTIVARAIGSINLYTQCGTAVAFPVCYDGATIAVSVNTEGGTKYQNNYAVPSASIAITSATLTSSLTTPSIALTVANVGCGSVTLSAISVAGLTANPTFKGSLSVTVPTSASIITVKASDPSSWTSSPSSGPVTISQGASTAITLSTTAAGSQTKISAGDYITIRVTTTIATTASGQYTA